jgi:hypothetical protein
MYVIEESTDGVSWFIVTWIPGSQEVHAAMYVGVEKAKHDFAKMVEQHPEKFLRIVQIIVEPSV